MYQKSKCISAIILHLSIDSWIIGCNLEIKGVVSFPTIYVIQNNGDVKF